MVYPAAAATMLARHANHTSEQLTQLEKNVLRPYFGSLVDNVRIVYGATPIEKWGSIVFSSEAAKGQVYGYNVYVRPLRSSMTDPERLDLLLHELVHVQQYEQNGKSLSNFGYRYFLSYAQADFKYANNVMEQAAAAFALANIDAVWSAYQA